MLQRRGWQNENEAAEISQARLYRIWDTDTLYDRVSVVWPDKMVVITLLFKCNLCA